MTTRHFYNSADGLVLKSLRGAVSLNPSLRLHSASRTVYTTDRSSSAKVSVICGGGAGHEPAYAGYTGRGMLTACVSGEIFASPSSKQILTTIRLAAFGDEHDPDTTRAGQDVLVVINNYTGDRLNFGLAIEKAKVLFPSINVVSVVVADDVSLLGSPTTQAVGPRGLAGNILVCKLLGALACHPTSPKLNIMKVYGDAVVENLASIGVALEHCHVPGRSRGEGLEPLDGDECEVGLGLHNEAGVYRRKMNDGGVMNVIKEMVDMISERLKLTGSGSEDETVLFVNNLGGVSQLEMGALLADLVHELDARGVHPRRIYLSSYMTSLNASGFSASLLNASSVNRLLASQGTAAVIDTYDLLDAPTDAHSWLGVRRYWGERSLQHENTHDYFAEKGSSKERVGIAGGKTTTKLTPIANALQSACQAVLKVEEELTEADTILGDGDCGHTFAAGALAVLAELQSSDSTLLDLDPAAMTEHISSILEDTMGGTIGALIGIYLNAYSFSLRSSSSSSSWNEAPLLALHSLAKHTTAKPGDRTVIDALHPFCHTLSSSGSLFLAVEKAIEGASKTRGMIPRLGRAAYVTGGKEGSSEGKGGGVIDPGAWGVAKLLEGFTEGWVLGEGKEKAVEDRRKLN